MSWDNNGEPVEFDYDGAEYRVYGTVSAEGDASVKRIQAYREWGWVHVFFSPASMLAAAACEALEQAWWSQLYWQEQRRLKNREGV